MHILLTNDDGPPGDASPFISYLVKALRAQIPDLTLSVCLPDVQKSWIGKAHLIDKTLSTTYWRPDTETTHNSARTDGKEEWVLVNGTPASCAQLGYSHLFKERGKVDLVISGPNFGRNSSALFALSSGTLGGAMEAATVGCKAIALSYAYETRQHDWDIVTAACKRSVDLIKHLYDDWPKDKAVHVYSINVPLTSNVSETKILWTHILQNTWSCCYKEVEVESQDDLDPDTQEAKIRSGEVGTGDSQSNIKHESLQKKMKKQYIWAPNFAEVKKSAETADATSDAAALLHGFISVTPLIINYMHVSGHNGEIKLKESDGVNASVPEQYALLNYSDDREYIEPLIRQALQQHLPGLRIFNNSKDLSETHSKLLAWTSYEELNFDSLLAHPEKCLFNAYIIRKALIRKHYLLNTVQTYLSKHPDSLLKNALPLSVAFEVDYAEFLDEALVEEYELLESMQENEGLPEEQRHVWILKPGMSDRGMGIRLFSTVAELQDIFDGFEEDDDDDEDEEDEADSKNEDENENEGAIEDEDGSKPLANLNINNIDGNVDGSTNKSTSIVTSQLRHFVAQKYISPLLLQPKSGTGHASKKFHIRTYVLALGALKIYVYKPMLALFSSKPYTRFTTSLSTNDDLSAHLTNTCLQSGAHDGSVRPFWSLSEHYDIDEERLKAIFKQVCTITGETFKAAVSGGRIHFQPLPCAFEIYGLDFLVGDDEDAVRLLEVNAFPDFKQTGDDLKGLIAGLFEGVVETAIKPFFEGSDTSGQERKDMVNVLDMDIGRF